MLKGMDPPDRLMGIQIQLIVSLFPILVTLLYSTPHDTEEHGLYTANVLISDTQLIIAHPPVKFSSMPSHALGDTSTDLCQLRHDACISKVTISLNPLTAS